MSFIQKLLRSKKVNIKNDPNESVDRPTFVTVTDSNQPESSVCDSGSESEGECTKEVLAMEMKQHLKAMRRHEERLRRRQADVMAIQAEIQALVTMISRCQVHNLALDEELLNKKCEIKFLQTEGPDSHEMHLQVKKNQPVLYKKYNNIKGSNEAKSLLTSIRQNQRALQYLELMTYNRYLEKQHGVHLDPVRKRTNILLKDKAKNFGHLSETLQAKKLSLKKVEPRVSSPTAQTATSEANNSSDTTFITVTSSSGTTTPTSGFTFGMPLLNMQQETTHSGSGAAGSFIPQIGPLPFNPFETSL